MYCFPKSARLLNRHDFTAVRNNGQEKIGRYLRIRAMPADTAKLGLIVSRRYGKAVARNRFKRQVREVYRHLSKEWGTPSHVVVLPKKAALTASSDQLKEDLNQLLTV